MLKSISESKFQMWRAVVAMAHADGRVSKEERDFIHSYFKSLNLSDEQKEQLQRELDEKADFDAILPLISEPADRAQVVHFSRVLCYRDGEFHPTEQNLLEKLNSNAMSKVDFADALKKSQQLMSENEVSQSEQESKDPKSSNKGFFGFFK